MKEFNPENSFLNEIDAVREARREAREKYERAQMEAKLEYERGLRESRERLVATKELRGEHYAVVGKLVNELRERVDEDPDTGKDDLFQMVEDTAASYALEEEQVWALKSGIEKYIAQHQIIEKYSEKYKNAEELYEACFGKKPQGRVEMQTSGACFYLQCFDVNDYAFAYVCTEQGGVADKVDKAQKEKADSSLGMAISGVRIPELNQCITLENTSKCMVDVNPEKRKVKRSEFTAQEFYLKEDHDKKVTFHIGNHSWNLSLEMGARNLKKMILYSEPDTFGTIKIKHDLITLQKKGKTFFELDGVVGEKTKVSLPLEVGGEKFAYVIVEDGKITVRNLSTSKVEMVEHDLRKRELNEALSESTRIHEEQHVFNKFFIPREGVYSSVVNDLSFSSAHFKNGREVIEELLKNIRVVVGFDSAA